MIGNIKHEGQKKFSAPYFQSHLKVSGPFNNSEEVLLGRLSRLNQQIESFLVRPDVFGYKEEHFESLYIQMVKDHELLRVKKIIDAEFGMDFDSEI